MAENDLDYVNDHMACDPLSPMGCSRCVPSPVQHCCDMCDLEYFVQFQVHALATDTNNDASESLSDGEQQEVACLARKSTVKPLKVTKEVVKARKDLYEWRRNKAEARFGADLVAQHGSHLLMPDSVVDRIVACAQVGKLPNLRTLMVETGWRQDLAEEYGESLLAVVCQHYPHQNTVTASRKQKPVKKTDENTTVGTRTMHCGACGGAGHNRKFTPLARLPISHCDTGRSCTGTPKPDHSALPTIKSQPPINAARASTSTIESTPPSNTRKSHSRTQTYPYQC